MKFALHLPVWILLAATLGACAGGNEPPPTAPSAAAPPSAPDPEQAAPLADEPPPAAPEQASANGSPVLNLATVDATLRAIVGEGAACPRPNFDEARFRPRLSRRSRAKTSTMRVGSRTIDADQDPRA
jgi:hypothetical protein